MRTFKYIAFTFLASLSFVGCLNDFDAISADSVILPEDTKLWEATMTIGELVDRYDRIDNIYVYDDDTLHISSDGTSYTLNKDAKKYYNQKAWALEYKDKVIKIQRETVDIYKGLFTNVPIESDNDIYIRGRVVSSDTAGNIYKYLIIEDLKTKQSLKISIDAGSLSGIFPLGQVIAVKCNGLVMGRYAQMPQLGVSGYRDDDKTRFEPGRMPYSLVPGHIIRIGVPDASKVIPTVVTIEEMLSKDSTWYGRLISIKNVKFTGKDDSENKLRDNKLPLLPLTSVVNTAAMNAYRLNPIFAPSTYDPIDTKKYNIGFPISREISDGAVSSYISTSEYAHFANTLIPNSNEEGTVTAIMGWFNDKNDKYDGKIQLTIRSLSDLDGFTFPKEVK